MDYLREEKLMLYEYATSISRNCYSIVKTLRGNGRIDVDNSVLIATTIILF